MTQTPCSEIHLEDVCAWNTNQCDINSSGTYSITGKILFLQKEINRFVIPAASSKIKLDAGASISVQNK